MKKVSYMYPLNVKIIKWYAIAISRHQYADFSLTTKTVIELQETPHFSFPIPTDY